MRLSATGAGKCFHAGADDAIFGDRILIFDNFIGNVLRCQIQVADDRDRVPGLQVGAGVVETIRADICQREQIAGVGWLVLADC